MPWVNQTSPTAAERVVGGLCYFTFGLAGLLYIIISGKSGQSSFFRFHFLQSIVLSIIGMLLSWCSNVFISLLGSLFGMLGPELGNQAVGWLALAVTLIVRASFLLLIYGMVWCFMGKYAEIPFISEIVRRQMR